MRKTTLAASIVSSVVSAAAWVSTYGLPFERPITPETAEAHCSSDPDTFFDHVRQQAENDLRTMKTTRNSLRTGSAELENKRIEVQEKLEYATKAADDFRAAWQKDCFPVVIHGRAYTRPEAEAQTSSLLAQIDGYSDAVAKYTRAITDIGQHVEDLTRRIVETETDMALLDSKCSVYKATRSESAGAELMASVDALFAENATVISASPVRSVDEMMQETSTATPVSHSRALSFLAGN
jgi:phage shock protein A